MSGIFVLALAVAAVNVGAGRWSKGVGGAAFWRRQATGAVFRFATLFGTATGVWMARRRTAEVAVFILVAVVAQLVGQIYFLLRNERHA